MRRIYDVPPQYGGSRFIRATHGVRALADGEFSSSGQAALSKPNKDGAPTPADGRKADARGGPRPDFEYFGNAIGSPKKGERPTDGEPRGERTQNAPREAGGTRYPPDEAYRGDPSPVDRYGHDFGASPPDDEIASLPAIGSSDRTNEPDGRGAKDAARPKHSYRPARSHSSVRVPRREPRPPQKGHEHHRGDGAFALSAEDGDLLLLALLALLAGEDGCADVVAALALLLAVR